MRRAENGFAPLPCSYLVAAGRGRVDPRRGDQRAAKEHGRCPASRLQVQDHTARTRYAAWNITVGRRRASGVGVPQVVDPYTGGLRPAHDVLRLILPRLLAGPAAT